MENIIPVFVIFCMINGCIGPRYTDIKWTKELNQRLMDIYHGTSPLEGGHLERIKQEWDSQVPEHAHLKALKLRKHGWDIMHGLTMKWEKRPMAEKEEMEERLGIMFKEMNNGQPNHERRMLDKLFELHPEYKNEFELMRTVVHKWWQRHIPRGEELELRNVKWTPELRADLLHILNQARSSKGSNIQKRIKFRWLKMHGDLNVKENCLLKYAYKLERKGYQPSAEEKNRAKEKYNILFPEEEGVSQNEDLRKGKRTKWSGQWKTDALYLRAMLEKDRGNIQKRMKDQWNRMHEGQSYLNHKTLANHVSYLIRDQYQPTNEELIRAKEKYAQLSPEEEQETKTQRRSSNYMFPGESSIHTRLGNLKETLEGHTWHQAKNNNVALHDNVTASSSYVSNHRKGETSSTLIPAGYDLQKYHEVGMRPETSHYDNSNRARGFNSLNYMGSHMYHHGSSSHSQLNQVPFELQQEIPHQYYHQWDYDASSYNPIPIDQIRSDSLPDTPRPHHLWNHGRSSNHNSINQVPLDAQKHSLDQYQHLLNHSGSSSLTPINEIPFDPQENFLERYYHLWNHNDSSSHTQIDQIPLDIQQQIQDQYRHQRDQGGSSSHSHRLP